MVKSKENFQVFLKPIPIKNDNTNTAGKTKPTSPKRAQKNLMLNFSKFMDVTFMDVTSWQQ